MQLSDHFPTPLNLDSDVWLKTKRSTRTVLSVDARNHHTNIEGFWQGSLPFWVTGIATSSDLNIEGCYLLNYRSFVQLGNTISSLLVQREMITQITKLMGFFCNHESDLVLLLIWTRRHLFVSSFSPPIFFEIKQCHTDLMSFQSPFSQCFQRPHIFIRI